jgi:hypothetical protein
MRVDFEVSPTHVDVASSLASMLVEDELVGPLKHGGRYLAVSNLAQLEEVPDEWCEAEGVHDDKGTLDENTVPTSLPAVAPPADHLPKSSGEVSDQQGEGDDDEFFDAIEEHVPGHDSPNSTSVKITEIEGLDLGDEAPDAQESSKLAHVSFSWKGLKSPLYNGVDSEVCGRFQDGVSWTSTL